MPRQAEDLMGRVFGALTVLRREFGRPGKPYWICLCVCGKEHGADAGNLKRGHVASCGCVGLEQNRLKHTTHGETGSKTYNVWRGMIKRCELESCEAYKNYGGRKDVIISVCQRWRDSYEAFVEDMGRQPEGLEIDRIDNNSSLGYCKENCHWTTAKQNCRNRRNNTIVEFDGQKMTISEVAERTGLKLNTILMRIKRGYSVAEAAKMPVKKNRRWHKD